MHPRRVLIAADFVPKKLGSIEYQLFRVGELLRARGLDVEYAFTGEIPPAVREHFGIPAATKVLALGDPKSPEGPEAWTSALRSRSPDACYLVFLPLVTPVIPALRHANPKVRIVYNDQISRGRYNRPVWKRLPARLRAQRYVECVDLFVACSEFIADRMRHTDFVPAEKLRVVYNAVDLERFPYAEGPGRHFVAITYMRPEKGAGVLLEALRLLKNDGLHPPCRMLGEGPELEAHREYARRHGLVNVELPGERMDVPTFVRDSIAAVVPSLWPEAFGLAAAEALAMGRPVIASRVGGLPEVVEDGVSGHLVAPGNPRELADAMARVFRDGVSEEMRRAARRRVEQRFNLADAVPKLAEMIVPA